MTISTLTKTYLENNSGHIAVTTALLALPLLLCASLAIDFQQAERGRIELQSALDSAAIAAITDQTLTLDERAKHAETRFWSNMSSSNDVSFKVLTSEDNYIKIEGQMSIPTTFAGIVNKDNIEFNETAAAELVKGKTVCMLALDPDSSRSFEVTKGATLNTNCSVQVNSIHNMASVVDHGGQLTAESICVTGGAQGKHDPFVNTECARTENPYLQIDIPYPTQSCVDPKALNDLSNDWRSERDAIENHEIEENQRWAEALAAGETWYPTYFEKNHLSPGNYCDGLFLEGKEFILDPGVYHITNGSLVFGLGTELIGEGVTFILHGDANLEIRDGSILNIKAPTTGPMAGLVIAQSLKNKSMDDPTYPNTTSTITEGAKLNVLGTIYLPSHKIQFLGGSLSKTHAPATSFIAHQISISDGADITVSSDHVAAGIPPIKPRSDDGARLVR